MTLQVLTLFAIQKEIFGLCPCCGDFFRLSDCHIFDTARPARTWFDKILVDQEKLDELEAVVEAKLEKLREKARLEGRRRAQEHVRRIDSVFRPRRLNADDAKPLGHPIDFIVFDGLHSTRGGSRGVRRVVFLDREPKDTARETLHRSLERVIKAGDVVFEEVRLGGFDEE